MGEYINVSVRVEKELKEQAEKLFSDLGLSTAGAIQVFLRQAVREERIPFEITLNPKSTDPK